MEHFEPHSPQCILLTTRREKLDNSPSRFDFSRWCTAFRTDPRQPRFRTIPQPHCTPVPSPTEQASKQTEQIEFQLAFSRWCGSCLSALPRAEGTLARAKNKNELMINIECTSILVSLFRRSPPVSRGQVKANIEQSTLIVRSGAGNVYRVSGGSTAPPALSNGPLEKRVTGLAMTNRRNLRDLDLADRSVLYSP